MLVAPQRPAVLFASQRLSLLRILALLRQVLVVDSAHRHEVRLQERRRFHHLMFASQRRVVLLSHLSLLLQVAFVTVLGTRLVDFH